ncbi:MAG: RraA family protein [Oscillospiraceae bacterium]|nr:RraA family protein [Oscillospiraceae bacterium]
MKYGKEKLDALCGELYTAVLADILDEIGEKDFCFCDTLRPMASSSKMIGYARTLYVVDAFETPEQPYQKDLAFIDSLQQGDVIITAMAGCNHNGYIGELLSTACIARGARGAIVDGYARDVALIDFDKFPLYCLGTNPLDSKGRVDAVAADTAVVCAGVLVHPGDLIFADEDGIVRVPAARVDTVIEKAVEKVRGENMVRAELRAGASVVEVFNKYGIL